MKTALCLYGLVGGKAGKDGEGGNINWKIAYDHYKRNIIDPNKADVFIHTWSIDHEKTLSEAYNPIMAEFQTQLSFPGNRDEYRARSRWYSTQRAINLKHNHEKKSGLYNMVMVARLDLAFLKPVDFSKYDPKYFWASHWNDVPHETNDFKGNHNNRYHDSGFLDLWFLSSSQKINEFGKLYDNINRLSKNQHRAAYQHVAHVIGKQWIKNTLYRWDDFELVRRYFLKSKK